MQKEIKQTWFFQQSPVEVWEYLTKPELIEQWLMKTDFQPVAGYKFRFTFQPKPGSPYEGLVNCEVLEVKPFTRLSYSWNGRTLDRSRSFNTIVVWTLVPKENGTELQLQHNGFEIADDILNHTSGWKSCLLKMEDQLNSVVK
ncbi:MAG: SRPBCC domain-containing protein [Flavisolibacter sp.]